MPPGSSCQWCETCGAAPAKVSCALCESGSPGNCKFAYGEGVGYCSAECYQEHFRCYHHCYCGDSSGTKSCWPANSYDTSPAYDQQTRAPLSIRRPTTKAPDPEPQSFAGKPWQPVQQLPETKPAKGLRIKVPKVTGLPNVTALLPV